MVKSHGKSKCDFVKLRSTLKLALNRLEYVQKRAVENATKSRAFIAELLSDKHIARAKIRVAELIRNDHYVEALDLLIGYYDVLISFIPCLEDTGKLQPHMATVVSTVLWSTSAIRSDIPEAAIVYEELKKLFGKSYTKACLTGSLPTICTRVRKKLDVVPGANLSELYLVEIAKTYEVDYTPDVSLLTALQSVALGENCDANTSSDDVIPTIFSSFEEFTKEDSDGLYYV